MPSPCCTKPLPVCLSGILRFSRPVPQLGPVPTGCSGVRSPPNGRSCPPEDSRRPTLRIVTTPPGSPPDPSRPEDWRSEPPAGSSGSSPSEPAKSPWDQPQVQQSTFQPGRQYPGPQYTGQPDAGQHYPGGQYPAQSYPGQGPQYPQSGQPHGYSQPGQYGQPQKSNGLGIAALVLGISSLPAAFFAGVPGIVLGLLAVVLGIFALRRVKARRADNRGMAITGLVLGILGLLLGILVLVFTLFVFQTAGDCLNQLQETGDQAAYEQCVQESVGQ